MSSKLFLRFAYLGLALVMPIKAQALDQYYVGSTHDELDGLYLGGVKVSALTREQRASLAKCLGASLCEFQLEMPTGGDLYKFKSATSVAPFKAPKDILDTIYRRVSLWDQSVFEVEDREAARFYTRDTASLIIKSNEAARKDQEESPAYSPWLTAQEWDVRAVKIDIDELGAGRAMGIVRYRNLAEEDPKPTTLTYDLQETPDGWRISDITFPYGTPGQNKKLSERLQTFLAAGSPGTARSETAAVPAASGSSPQNHPRDDLFELIYGASPAAQKPITTPPQPMTMPLAVAPAPAAAPASGRSQDGSSRSEVAAPAATSQPPARLVTAGATFPDCARLADFPIGQLGSVFAYGDKDEIIGQYFGAKLTDWTDADFESFKSRFIGCREADESFHKRFARNYFIDRNRGPVAETASLMREQRSDQLEQAKIDAQGQALLDQVQALGAKARNLSASAEDIVRLEQLKTDGETLWRKLLIQSPRRNSGPIKKAANEAEAAVLAYRSGIEQRANAEAAEKQRAVNAKSDVQASALQLLIVYAMTDYCADKGAIFTKAQTKQLQAAVKTSLDQNGVPQDARDKTWVAAQQGIKISGLDQMYGKQLESECNGLRTTLIFSMPQIFASPEDVKKTLFDDNSLPMTIFHSRCQG